MRDRNSYTEKIVNENEYDIVHKMAKEKEKIPKGIEFEWVEGHQKRNQQHLQAG